MNIKELMKGVELTDEQLDSMQKQLDQEIVTNATGLKNKNQELIDKLKESKGKQIPDGFDLDGYNDYVSNADQIAIDKAKAEEDALVAKQNWNKLKNDMTNNHEKTVGDLITVKDTEISGLRNSLDTILIENAAFKEIDAVKGSQILLIPHIKNSIKTFQDENGQYSTKVVDASGADRMNAETGEVFTVKELVAEFQANEAFAGAFPIQNKGSGSRINAGGSGFNSTNNPFDRAGKHYSITEQAKLMKTNPTLAKTLKDAV